MSLTIDVDRMKEFVDGRRREVTFAAGALVVALALVAVLYWWFAVRWKPPPSIFDNPVDDALGYLALPDFNKLSLEERMKFLMDLADRFRNLAPSESAAAAAFLAGVVGPAREQLQQNARELAKDILASAAAEYMNLPESERGAFIDKWLVDWMKTGERITRGEERKRTDDERLAAIDRDADRERERQRESDIPAPSDRTAGRFLDFWQSEVEKTSTPKQQGQIVKFMTDVRQRLRQ